MLKHIDLRCCGVHIEPPFHWGCRVSENGNRTHTWTYTPRASGGACCRCFPGLAFSEMSRSCARRGHGCSVPYPNATLGLADASSPMPSNRHSTVCPSCGRAGDAGYPQKPMAEDLLHAILLGGALVTFASPALNSTYRAQRPVQEDRRSQNENPHAGGPLIVRGCSPAWCTQCTKVSGHHVGMHGVVCGIWETGVMGGKPSPVRSSCRRVRARGVPLPPLLELLWSGLCRITG
jgi:hypothetical protein